MWKYFVTCSPELDVAVNHVTNQQILAPTDNKRSLEYIYVNKGQGYALY